MQRRPPQPRRRPSQPRTYRPGETHIAECEAARRDSNQSTSSCTQLAEFNTRGRPVNSDVDMYTTLHNQHCQIGANEPHSPQHAGLTRNPRPGPLRGVRGK